jgi:sRNA-binding protein
MRRNIDWAAAYQRVLDEGAGEKFAAMSDDQFADWVKHNPGGKEKATKLRNDARAAKGGGKKQEPKREEPKQEPKREEPKQEPKREEPKQGKRVQDMTWREAGQNLKRNWASRAKRARNYASKKSWRDLGKDIKTQLDK